MTPVTELELNTRAFAPPFVHIPFIPVGRTKECQECAHILLQVGYSAVRFKNVPLTTESKISLRSRSCSPAINIIVFYQKISSFIQQQLKYISTTCQTAMTTSGKIYKNNQFQNTHAGFTIFSVHSQHLKSSSSAFRPALSKLWLLLVIYLIIWRWN